LWERWVNARCAAACQGHIHTRHSHINSTTQQVAGKTPRVDLASTSDLVRSETTLDRQRKPAYLFHHVTANITPACVTPQAGAAQPAPRDEAVAVTGFAWPLAAAHGGGISEPALAAGWPRTPPSQPLGGRPGASSAVRVLDVACNCCRGLLGVRLVGPAPDGFLSPEHSEAPWQGCYLLQQVMHLLVVAGDDPIRTLVSAKQVVGQGLLLGRMCEAL
jgi:hypothetical protein